MKTLILVIVLAALGVGGYALIGKTTPTIPQETQLAFGEDLIISVNDTVTLADGLKVTLNNISDSRCKPDVQCIWQGELSAELSATGGQMGKSLKSIRLGTVMNGTAIENGYTFTLKSATETSVTLVVTAPVLILD